MISSMTGYGMAQQARDGVNYAAEVRTVNGRYLKLLIKLPESLQFAESEIDKLVRGRVSRGVVTFALRSRCDGAESLRPLNTDTIQAYADQLAEVNLPGGVRATIDLATLATLPGASDIGESDSETRAVALETVKAVATSALDAVVEMRREEGRGLLEDLTTITGRVREELSRVAERAPIVIDDYHERLRLRVGMLTKTAQLELDSDSLMREVAVYAERSDIAEEINRLGSHLDQFAELCRRKEPVGRTLDFLSQEMLREINTIGSKSNDAAIARSVVEIKGLIDRVKEQVQNVE